MSAAVEASYGEFACKNLALSKKFIFKGENNTNGHTIELECEDPTTGGAKYTLPAITGNQTLLHNGSDIDATQVDIDGATVETTPVDTDTFLFFDASAPGGGANRKVTGANLKTYVGAGASLPSGTSAQVIVYDGTNTAQSVNMSGDVTIDNTGATTLANNAVSDANVDAGANIAQSKLNLAITDSEVAAGANIAKNKLANLAIADADVDAGANIAQSKLNLSIADAQVAVGANIAKSKLANLAIADADVDAGANIATSKLAINTLVPTTAGTAEASKFVQLDANKDIAGIRHADFEGDVEVPSAQAFYLGDKASDGTWRIDVSGGNLRFSVRTAGSYAVKSTVSSN